MAQLNWDAFERNRTHNYVERTPEQLDAGRNMGKETTNPLDSMWDSFHGGTDGIDYVMAYIGAFLFAIFAGKYINDFLRSQSSITYIVTIAVCFLLVKGSYIFASFFLVSPLIIFIIYIMSMVSSTGKNVWYAFDTRYRHRVCFEEILMSYMAQFNFSPPSDKFADRCAFAVYMADIMVSDKYYKDFDHNNSITYIFQVLSSEAKSGNHNAEYFLTILLSR